jgi:hypothetical protein
MMRMREKDAKRAHTEKKKSRDKEKRRGTEDKRTRTAGPFVEDETDDDYSPRSSEKKSSRHRIEEEIRMREEAARAARAADAAREAARAQIKEAPMDPKWNEHMDFAGKYMQAARRKGAAEESAFQHPGLRRAETYTSPTSREYNLRHATPEYSDDDAPRRSSAPRRTSETPSTRRDRSRSRRSPSHPRDSPYIVEPASPPRMPTLQTHYSAPPNLSREKPTRSKTQDYPRNQPASIPPLPRAQTFQSGDRGRDRDHRSSGLKKEVSASDSDSDDYRSPHHSSSPPHRRPETRYVVEGNRAVPIPTTSRHRADMHGLNETYVPRERSESPRGTPSRPPLTRNPPSSERPRTATRSTSYYTAPEAPEPIILTARPKLAREQSGSRSIPLHKVQYSPAYTPENVTYSSNRPGPDLYDRARRDHEYYTSHGRGVYASG